MPQPSDDEGDAMAEACIVDAVRTPRGTGKRGKDAAGGLAPAIIIERV